MGCAGTQGEQEGLGRVGPFGLSHVPDPVWYVPLFVPFEPWSAKVPAETLELMTVQTPFAAVLPCTPEIVTWTPLEGTGELVVITIGLAFVAPVIGMAAKSTR